MSYSRRLVVDANILVRAALGKRVWRLIDEYSDSVAVFTPHVALDDARRHVPRITADLGWSDPQRAEAAAALEDAIATTIAIPGEELERLRTEALARIAIRDPDDWVVVAAALLLDCPIWTEDQDFFGCGVATWTSDRVEIYLRG